MLSLNNFCDFLSKKLAIFLIFLSKKLAIFVSFKEDYKIRFLKEIKIERRSCKSYPKLKNIVFLHFPILISSQYFLYVLVHMMSLYSLAYNAYC